MYKQNLQIRDKTVQELSVIPSVCVHMCVQHFFATEVFSPLLKPGPLVYFTNGDVRSCREQLERKIAGEKRTGSLGNVGREGSGGIGFYGQLRGESSAIGGVKSNLVGGSGE